MPIARSQGRLWRILIVLGLCQGIVSACDHGEPAGKPSPQTKNPPATPSKPTGIEHTVGEGETLWDIAATYGVSVKALMDANHLDDRAVRRLSKGAKLFVPGATGVKPIVKAAARRPTLDTLPPLTDGAYHFVGEHETIWDIARSYDVSADDIVARNHFSDDDLRKIRPGDAVVIPGIAAAQVKKAEPPTRNGIMHVMEPGETIWDLANRFQVSAGEIMAANAFDEARVKGLRDGTKVFLPGVTKDKRGEVRRERTPSQGKATALAQRLGLGSRKSAGELLKGRVRSAWLAAAGGPRFPRTLKWPVSNGHFVRGYGSGEGGYHLATDIAGDIGWNVRAAAPGIVGYSGHELRGFGNLVMVIHPGGWVTLYGHNSANFVVAGQRVDRGTILAEVGSTGLSRGPHVHFEFIYDGKNCDPLSLFRPGIRYRAGRVRTRVLPAEWRRPNDRPKSIKCASRIGHPKSFWILDENPTRDAEPLPKGDAVIEDTRTDDGSDSNQDSDKTEDVSP